jgi:hypothetical protein
MLVVVDRAHAAACALQVWTPASAGCPQSPPRLHRNASRLDVPESAALPVRPLPAAGSPPRTRTLPINGLRFDRGSKPS